MAAVFTRINKSYSKNKNKTLQNIFFQIKFKKGKHQYYWPNHDKTQH